MSRSFIKSMGKLVIPSGVRPLLRRRWLKIKHAGIRHQCCCCGSFLRGFLPHGNPPAPNFLCPVCRSKPPHRLAALMFDRHPEWFRSGGLLVHIAPEAQLRIRLLQKAQDCGMRYRCGGITGCGDEFLDLLNLPFADGSVDLLYCCHVLNSLQNDKAAMKEVHRVMKPDGVALLQVPAFFQGAATLETNSLEERLSIFHDEGIFRCYTDGDYVERLSSVGFRVHHLWAEQLPQDVLVRHQLKKEVLHVCRREDGSTS